MPTDGHKWSTHGEADELEAHRPGAADPGGSGRNRKGCYSRPHKAQGRASQGAFGDCEEPQEFTDGPREADPWLWSAGDRESESSTQPRLPWVRWEPRGGSQTGGREALLIVPRAMSRL